MGWGTPVSSVEGDHPSVIAARSSLIAAVRRYLKLGTTGNIEAMRDALDAYDRANR